jgi:hypothetical protein
LQLPPEKVKWIEDLLYLLGDFGKTLVNVGNQFNFYRHYGPIVLNVDVTPQSLSATKICPDGECTDCFATGLLTLALGRSWEQNVFNRMFLDHQYYLGADMDNANCKMNGKSYYTPIIYD